MANQFLFSVALAVFAFGCSDSRQNSPSGGGYGFPHTIEAADSSFPYYPLRDLMTDHEHSQVAFFDSWTLRAFEEPNLSLRPANEPVLRFWCEGMGPAYLITVTNDRIVVKKSENLLFEVNDERLSEKGRMHFAWLEFNFPLQDQLLRLPSSPKRDSLISRIKQFPELLLQSYYDSLRNRRYVNPTVSFRYSLRTIQIEPQVFSNILEDLKATGYWRLPPKIKCNNPSADGGGHLLEANIGQKYNAVAFPSCDRLPPFTNVCREIVTLAELRDSIIF